MRSKKRGKEEGREEWGREGEGEREREIEIEIRTERTKRIKTPEQLSEIGGVTLRGAHFTQISHW